MIRENPIIFQKMLRRDSDEKFYCKIVYFVSSAEKRIFDEGEQKLLVSFRPEYG